MSLSFILTVAAACFALMLVGGGFYEVLVVDPFWPKRPELIQPDRGGISRRRFSMPVHTVFELSVVSALVAAWSAPPVRSWLWVALISNAVARIWSAFDFIPKALEIRTGGTRIYHRSISPEMDASKYFSPAAGIADVRRYACGICALGTDVVTSIKKSGMSFRPASTPPSGG